jgi:hypothetical protein
MGIAGRLTKYRKEWLKSQSRAANIVKVGEYTK